MTTHGHTSKGKCSSEYRAWAGMRQRCSNPKNTAYRYYGGRGITVCPEWSSFEQFIADMGRKPRLRLTPTQIRFGMKPQRLTIERLDNNQGYSPDNCVWATFLQQANNTRRTQKPGFVRATKRGLPMTDESTQAPEPAPTTDVAVLLTMTPAQIFAPGKLNEVLAAIDKEARAEAKAADPTTTRRTVAGSTAQWP